MDWFNLGLILPVAGPTQIFLPALLTILFAPILLNKLCIPYITGMILIGLVISEHGFSILVCDNSFELFGKVGLYYIVFLAGLEMNMGDSKKNRGKVVILGLLAFIIPIGMDLVINMMLLKYSLMTSVLLVGMYASYTLVAYPIVTRYGVPRYRSASTVVGGIVVTDTLTLLVLAVVSGLFKRGSGGLFWSQLVIEVVFLGALIMYSSPRIGRWFSRRYDDNAMQFIFVLAVVFLDAGPMKFAGMEGILGVFLAGLVLNRLIPCVSSLMNHLEFMGSTLFIPYLLMGVGVLIDIHVIFGQGGVLKVTAVMITVALVGKWIALWLTRKIYKVAPIERELMLDLSNAQATATLVAVLVGYNITLPGGERLLNENVLSGMALLILVTCVVSSFTTERTARKIAMCEAYLEEERTAETERILIPIVDPDMIEYLMNLSLLIRDIKQKDNLLALNVANDNDTSEDLKLRDKRYSEKIAMITAFADIPLQQTTRYDLDVASSIVHTTEEYGIADAITGLHRKVSIVDSLSDTFAKDLLKDLHREVMIAKLLTPINTIRRTIIAVPPEAEYETGFQKWVEYFCRIGDTLGCRVRFFVNEEITVRLQALVKRKCGQTLMGFSRLDDRGDLSIPTDRVNYDHSLAVISARRGSVSYDSSFEKLPAQLGKYLSNNNLVVLYLDQLSESRGAASFPNPRSEVQHYEKVGKWIYKWFKES